MDALLGRLPHRPPMLLLEGLDAEGAYATVDPGAWYADEAGAMPGWIGLELMAQAAAAHRGPGAGAGRGYLVAARSYRSLPAFPAGARLRVEARPEAEEEGQSLAAYHCEILLEGVSVAQAILKVFRP